MNRVRLGNSSSGWRKGQSGNPGGRPKTPEEIKALLRSGLPAAVRTVIRLATYSKNENIRLAAAREILDRNLGKPAVAEAPSEAVQPVQNVVRVPYPAASIEEWEREVAAWRSQKAALRRAEAEQFLRDHPQMTPGTKAN